MIDERDREKRDAAVAATRDQFIKSCVERYLKVIGALLKEFVSLIEDVEKESKETAMNDEEPRERRLSAMVAEIAASDLLSAVARAKVVNAADCMKLGAQRAVLFYLQAESKTYEEYLARAKDLTDRWDKGEATDEYQKYADAFQIAVDQMLKIDEDLEKESAQEPSRPEKDSE